MKTAKASFWATLGFTLTLAMTGAAFTPTVSANEGVEIAQPDYGFRWGVCSNGTAGRWFCKKKYAPDVPVYDQPLAWYPAPPLKCKYIRWGCPKR